MLLIQYINASAEVWGSIQKLPSLFGETELELKQWPLHQGSSSGQHLLCWGEMRVRMNCVDLYQLATGHLTYNNLFLVKQVFTK